MKRITSYSLPFIFTLSLQLQATAQTITKVGAVGITVKDMTTAEKFYSQVLGFKKISDSEYQGEEYEKLEGLFGLHIRVVVMQLGDEQIELTDYLTSGGRSIPEDARA